MLNHGICEAKLVKRSGSFQTVDVLPGGELSGAALGSGV